MKSASTTSCATANGGSLWVGASAFQRRDFHERLGDRDEDVEVEGDRGRRHVVRRHAPASRIGYRARSATARTTREMIPTTCDGKSRVVGKANPVTLVATVVTRKSVFQPPCRRPPSSPNRTTSPAPIPIRLSTT